MGYERILCVFQSHTYSRTAALYGDFVRAFSQADVLLFTPIYAAREENVYGLDEAAFARDAGAELTAGFADAASRIRTIARPGDLILVMGAGDVYHVSNMIVNC
jgi:UDP-N-acetylmuramate--alanine ligase